MFFREMAEALTEIEKQKMGKKIMETEMYDKYLDTVNQLCDVEDRFAALEKSEKTWLDHINEMENSLEKLKQERDELRTLCKEKSED